MTFPARLLLLLALLSTWALHAEPQWIWTSKKAEAREKATFKHSFNLKVTPKSALLSLTCDNGATVFINGKQAVVNEDWQKPVKVDVIKFLELGATNVIEVHATNKGGSAGLIAKLELEKQKGGVEVIETNAEWQSTATGQTDWKPVVVLGHYGSGPWGKVFDGKVGVSKKDGPVIAAADITVPAGFKVELLYSVPKEEQGSWVALTTDDKGRLIACDQYGSLYRMSVPAIGKTELLKPEKLAVDFGKAHGLLHAFGSLYVMVNENGKDNGLYRLQDTDKDDQYDKFEKLVTMAGGGEHGLHSMVVSPDGKRIYFNGGNHTELPTELSKSRPAKLWDEDHILPRMWDANGHARGRMAPGGFICSMTPDGKDVELFCYGFRNHFDITFDLSGELFTYDADMEWDIGSPWYRPTRVNHCVSGADYGWRSGSGKWPQYYPDNLPTTLDIGPGSPTGVVSGKGAKFPAKYQRAVFINDWTYGTMWAVNLHSKGGSFLAEKEEFVFGKPLPLTDVIIHPQDGAMYFAIGGRRTQSGVYRVSYIGEESTAPVQALPLDEETRMRQTLDAMHQEGGDPQKILAAAWPYLSHSDRHVRYAARVAIEKLPPDLWQEKALTERHPMTIIEATIALARIHGTRTQAPAVKPAPGSSSLGISDVAPENIELQLRMLETLSRLEGAELSLGQHLGALRALQLIFIRLGKPAPEVCEAILEKLEPLYPSEDDSINRELCQILIALDSTQAPAKTIALMATAKDDFQAVATDAVLSRNDGYANAARAAAGSRPNAQQISYMFALRNAKVGWTPELRKTFFSWFPRARTWKGGNSFKGFIENIRKDSLATFVPEAELAEMEAISSKVEGADIPNYVAPKGPGKAWSVEEVVTLTGGGLKGRNFKNGEAMYRSVMCATCHRFNGDGGSIGPDLTGSGNRYTMHDLMENIVDPSKVISDQYDSHQITMKDGSTILGRIVVEENGKVFVMANPFAPNDQLAINESEIASKETRKVSMMPPGLINALNQDELLDLLAYLISGGNDQDKAFK
jgi:putative heme-binding domain-containing protein